MSEIRAFVGHSFIESDANVVGRFLKYFDQLSRSSLNFSWEHAEAAEPKILADKVMTMLENKNVFIGICTKKELAINENRLSTPIIYRGCVKAPKSAFSWKTSDWIIQEIGLAKGKGLELILLIEEGVRAPGGLQGNVEYISFERDNPEKAFGKIVEMITALSPNSTAPAEKSTELTSELPEKSEDPARLTNVDRTTPKPNWDRSDYEFALRHKILIDDDKGADEINRAYLVSEDAKRDENRWSWEATREFYQIRFSGDGSFPRLKALAESHPENNEIIAYLARACAHYGNYQEAAKYFELASEKTNNILIKMSLLGRAGVHYVRANLPDTARRIMDDMRDMAELDDDKELILLGAIREISETLKEIDAEVAAMERIIDLRPSDTSTRFSIAYKNSQLTQDDLALFHYLKIPLLERSSSAWNNLGVAFEKFALHGKSILAYQSAIEKDETLAMSNIAEKLISVGFFKEAQAYCDKALIIKDYHKNVTGTISKIKSLPEDEEIREKDILDKTSPKSEFYKEFGRAMCLREPREFAEFWQGPKCVLQVTLSRLAFTAQGAYEQAAMQGLLLAVFSRSAVEPPPDRFQVRYEGIMRGRAVEASLSQTKDGEPPPTILSDARDQKNKVLMIIGDAGDVIRVMEREKNGKAQFYSLKPINRALALSEGSEPIDPAL